MSRNQSAAAHWRRAVVFAGSSTAGGILGGAALGAFGSVLPDSVRLAIGTLGFLALCVVGVLQVRGRRVRLPQRNKETPQRWIQKGPVRWALKNGFSLGLGFGSRLGFWLWYVIPLLAVTLGDPWLSAALYGTYGATRGLGTVSVFGFALRRHGWNYSDWLLHRAQKAALWSSYILAAISAALVVQIGLIPS